MFPANLSDTVVVFDLDDTLYQEKDYVTSGIAHVCEVVAAVTAIDVEEAVEAARIHGGDLWSVACAAGRLPESAKEQLLWLYRLHQPSITLSQGAHAALADSRKKARATAILTDGRSVTQRLKLRALGLSDLPAFISEEMGWGKPDRRAYQKVMEQIPASQYIYIADNPAKDFVTANALGWMTIGLLPREGGIHSFEMVSIPETHRPQSWIKDLGDLVIQ